MFHTSPWIRVLHETYGFRPGCIVHIEEDTVRGILPFMETRSITNKRRCVSLPFSDFCEPIFENCTDFKNALDQLILKGNENEWSFIEIRGGKQFLTGTLPYMIILAHDIDLTRSEEDLFRSFRSSTQRNIRKAEKDGITVSFNTSYEALKTFYRLNCVTRRHHGLPPQPFSFFDRLYKEVIQCENGFISLAHFGLDIIAGAFFVFAGKTIYYKYGASEKRFQHHRPNDLLFSKVINEYTRRGYTRLNLGRTELTHKGLLQFKRNFGANESEICYYVIDCTTKNFIVRPEEGSFHSGLTKTFSVLPIPALQIIGRLFYRFMG